MSSALKRCAQALFLLLFMPCTGFFKWLHGRCKTTACTNRIHRPLIRCLFYSKDCFGKYFVEKEMMVSLDDKSEVRPKLPEAHRRDFDAAQLLEWEPVTWSQQALCDDAKLELSVE